MSDIRMSIPSPRVHSLPDPSPSASLQAPAPRPLETLSRPQAPCSRPPATPHPPRPCLPLESPCPPQTDGNPPLFYRTLNPSDPLPCISFIEKRASNGLQYPMSCSAHFRLPKCVQPTVTGPVPSFSFTALEIRTFLNLRLNRWKK